MLIHFLIRQTCHIVILSSGFISIVSYAGVIETANEHLNKCGQQYNQHSLPELLDNKNRDLYYLCFEGFGVGYSGVTKTAVWSAEHLTRQRIETANTLERVDNFHEESRLPNSAKALLADYQKTGYDRGHLSPNADMATLEQQYDSFSLANMVPQNPKNNRGTWKSLEARTRYLALKHGEIYVVTGTAYLGKSIKKLHNHVYVPSHLYKAIYVPSLNQAGVYFVPNNDSQQVEVISLQELALRTGVDVMPSATDPIRQTAMSLPTDTVNTSSQPKTTTQSPSSPSSLIANLLLAIFQWLIQLLQK